MDWQKKQAFTLVELIVVITILAILGTVAFISLQWYSASARDSTRISDMWSMKSVLELFKLEAGKYPLPNDETVITYSGAIAWTQGSFWKTVYSNVGKLDKIPTDPLSDKKYAYSTTSTRQEMQLAGIMEGDDIALSGMNSANAWTKTAILKVTGNFNGKVLKVSTWSTNYILAVPGLMSSSGTSLENIVANNSLAYNGYKNLPFQFDWGSYTVTGEVGLNLVNSSKLVVFSGDLNLLSKTDASGQTARSELISNLQNAYRGTVIANVKEINEIILAWWTSTEKLATSIVNHDLWLSILAWSENPTGWTKLDPNCDIPDIEIKNWSGVVVQTWAGCNSTLWTGIERWKQDNGTNWTIWSCYDYNDNNTATCTIWSSDMASNTKANTWYTGTTTNGDQEYPAIWWKLYIWANSSSACPSWRHVPTDAEWEILETTLNGLNCRNSTNGWLCTGLGWILHNTKTTSNNMAQALKIPLAGYRDTNGVTFLDRGRSTHLWSSTPNAGNAYYRFMYWHISTIARNADSQAYGFNVRCLKD